MKKTIMCIMILCMMCGCDYTATVAETISIGTKEKEQAKSAPTQHGIALGDTVTVQMTGEVTAIKRHNGSIDGIRYTVDKLTTGRCFNYALQYCQVDITSIKKEE